MNANERQSYSCLFASIRGLRKYKLSDQPRIDTNGREQKTTLFVSIRVHSWFGKIRVHSWFKQVVEQFSESGRVGHPKSSLGGATAYFDGQQARNIEFKHALIS